MRLSGVYGEVGHSAVHREFKEKVKILTGNLSKVIDNEIYLR